MQFRVPQFIDIEDKILGPLTWKQASYCLGAGGVMYLSLRFIDSKLIALLVASPFLGLFLSMAFVKINNQSFVEVLEHAFNFYSKNNLYTWKNGQSYNIETTNIVKKVSSDSLIPKQSKKSLKDIAIGLDTKVDKPQ